MRLAICVGAESVAAITMRPCNASRAQSLVIAADGLLTYSIRLRGYGRAFAK